MKGSGVNDKKKYVHNKKYSANGGKIINGFMRKNIMKKIFIEKTR